MNKTKKNISDHVIEKLQSINSSVVNILAWLENSSWLSWNWRLLPSFHQCLLSENFPMSTFFFVKMFSHLYIIIPRWYGANMWFAANCLLETSSEFSLKSQNSLPITSTIYSELAMKKLFLIRWSDCVLSLSFPRLQRRRNVKISGKTDDKIRQGFKILNHGSKLLFQKKKSWPRVLALALQFYVRGCLVLTDNKLWAFWLSVIRTWLQLPQEQSRWKGTSFLNNDKTVKRNVNI